MKKSFVIVFTYIYSLYYSYASYDKKKIARMIIDIRNNDVLLEVIYFVFPPQKKEEKEKKN